MTNEAITTSWHTYPKLYALGQRIIADIFQDEVIVEEKIDGSQFSFGIFDGEVRCRSKGAILNLLAPEKMFILAVETVKKLAESGLLTDGVTYRAEYLAKPKHNTLAYDRAPANYLIGFDVNYAHEHYLSYQEKVDVFARLGLETVPLLHSGMIDNLQVFRELLSTQSILGGQKVEGVVVKNYSKFGPDGKAMMGKFVSEEFKEVHKGDFKERNPGQNDIITQLINVYKTPARWRKSIQHLKEAGKLEGSPKDIGLLMKEVKIDVAAECKDEIKDKLYQWAWEQIGRGIISGLPEWYKEELLKQSFE